MQFFEDRVGRGGPLERLAVGVVVGDEVIDALHELFDAGERVVPEIFIRAPVASASNLA